MQHRNTYLHYLLLTVVLLVAAGLRLYDFAQVPLFNDELSALNRLRFDSFSDLLEKGIMPDGHPAGVQTFLYYWTSWFGTGEWAVRLPFIGMGLLGILLAYAIGRRWFNETVGLWVAVSLSVLQYPIYFTSIARPYASGLFFCMAMVGCWTLLIFSSSKRKLWPLMGYVLTAVLCAYNHYFSMLFAGMVGITGLFYLNSANRKSYLLANALVLLLYLPHVPVFFNQLQTGGIGGWLAAPGSDFLIQYINYILHFSPIMWAACIIAGAVGLMLHTANQRPEAARFRRIALIWFLTPLIIGTLYSVFVAPVLHQGVLFFTFPFLLLLLFSFYPKLKAPHQAVILGFAAIGIFSLIQDRQHFDLMRNRGAEMVVQNSLAWADSIGKMHHTAAFNVNHPYYVRYYYAKYGDSLNVPIYQLEGKRDQKQFREVVQASAGTTFSLGWVSRETPLEYLSIIRERYPYLVRQEMAFVSEWYVFSQEKPIEASPPVIGYQSHNSFEHRAAFWENGTGTPIPDTLQADNTFWEMDSTDVYGPTFSRPTEDLFLSRHDLLLVSVAASLLDSAANPQLVVSVAADTGTVFWRGIPFQEQISPNNGWGHLHFGMRMREYNWMEPGMKLSIYIWNPEKRLVWIDDIEVLVLPGNPKLFGLAEPLD